MDAATLKASSHTPVQIPSLPLFIYLKHVSKSNFIPLCSPEHGCSATKTQVQFRKDMAVQTKLECLQLHRLRMCVYLHGVISQGAEG